MLKACAQAAPRLTTGGQHTAKNAGLRGGREISRDGVNDLPMGRDALTGYTIGNAERIADAERLAEDNPFVSGIRVYAIASH